MNHFRTEYCGKVNLGTDSTPTPTPMKYPDKVIVNALQQHYKQVYDEIIQMLETQQQTGKTVKEQVQGKVSGLGSGQDAFSMQETISQKRNALSNAYEQNRKQGDLQA